MQISILCPFIIYFGLCAKQNTYFGPLTEGTTTNGDYLLPFKTGVFLAKAPVLPVILRYPYQRFSPAWDSISGVSCFCLWRLYVLEGCHYWLH